MILFFLATTLFHDIEKQDKKVFNTHISKKDASIIKNKDTEKKVMKFKLMESSY